MIDFKGYCKSCAIAGLKAPQICALSGLKVTETDYCSFHRGSLSTCAICGSVILQDGYIDEGHLICPNCFSQITSCRVCRGSLQCAFEEDPSPTPKVISQQIRQGNGIYVTTVRNPERVRETCQKGCKCFDTKNGCLRQNGFCSNHEVYYND